MNKIVSLYEVYGFSVRIKDAETNTPFGTIASTEWTQTVENPSVTFELGSRTNKESLASKLNVGRYYKLQLAYQDEAGNDGYYSTICIIKFTSEPSLSLLNMNRYMTNNDLVEYIGQYNNLGDTSEKAYQYKFTFRDVSGNVLETSGWIAHNANTNTEMGISTDRYDLMYSVQPDQKYTMQYSVITNNGLECSSPRYQIVGSTSIAPELSADLMADLDYDNGCVNLRLKQSYLKIIDPETGQREAPRLSGSFILTRASSVEDFTIWTKLYTFHLTGQLPEGVIFSDYTCEHGQVYKYAIQQFNTNGIYSSRMYAEIYEKDDDDILQPTGNSDIIVNFEDMFLYDGERQLRIRFNPKVSSFKTVLQEAKKTTLGSQFPFFFRNGSVAYKEFPISGLISYMIDENEFFLDRQKDLKMPADWQDTTDITDKNLIYERRFKLEVLNWLNNGEVKLFRSPAEGNYLVRLMGVQLTPNDSLSRMIHTFQCTATEIDSYTPMKLQSYGFLKASPEIPKQLRFGTIQLSEYIEMLVTKANGDVEAALEAFKQYDILKGFSCQYIHIEDVLPSTEFKLNRESFYVGATGDYEAKFTDNPRGLYIVNPRRHMSGTITYGVLTATSNSFDTVTSIRHRDIFDVPEWTGNNYMISHNTIKDRMNKIYFMRFYLNDLVYEFATLAEFQQRYGVYMRPAAEYMYDKWVEDATIDQNDEVIPSGVSDHYMIFLEGNAAPGLEYKYLDDYYHKVYTSDNEFHYEYIQRGAQDLYINNTIIRTNEDGKVWRYTIYQSGGHEGMYGILSLIGQETDALNATKVYIDNDIIDLSLTQEAYLPTSNGIPKSVTWGSAVYAEICYQDLIIDYGVEDNFIPMIEWSNLSMDIKRQTVNESHKYYDAYKLQLVPYTVNTTMRAKIRDVQNNSMYAYFVWDGDSFHRLTPEERTSVVLGAEVWMCFSKWQYNESTGSCVYNNSLENTTTYMNVKTIGTDQNWVSASLYHSQYDEFMEMIASQLEAEEKELIFSDE